MMMRGDFDLNSIQGYSGSLNDVLRKTMLNQEVVFKDQVHELHHLYRTQKTLMQNADWKEYHRYNCSKASAQSTLSNCSNSTRDGPRDLFEGCKSIYDKIQPRPPGLKHPLDPSVRHIDPAELKLSLSIREDNRREGGTKRTWFDVGSHASLPIVIDLEESSEMASNEGLEQSPFLSSAAPLTNFRGKGNSKASILFDPIITSSVKKNLFFGAAVSNSPLDDSVCNPFNQESNRCFGALSINKLSTRRQQFSSCEPGLLDLNKTQPDDSSCLSNDPIVAHPSTASSSHAFRGLAGKIEEGTVCFATEKKEHNNCSNESSETLHAGHFSFLNSNRKNEKTEYLDRSLKVDAFGISEMDPVSLEAAVSRSKSDFCEAVGCNSNDPKNASDGFILKLLNSRIHSSAGSKQAKSENTKEEDPAISYSDHSKKTDQDGHGYISSSSSKPCCIGDNDSSSVKTTQSEVEFGNSNPFSSDQFSGTHVGSQVSETLMDEQDQRSSDSSEFKHKCVNKEEESAEVDALTREAAEALLGMSLESSSCYQDCAGKVGESNKGEKESDKPQYSCDFFELMTLTLTESSVDDYPVSSNPSEVNFTESKNVGLKLRRGRRLKDFQKDILPGLASLSRHEIREDINIMEGVLRSREYKRLQAKMADGHSWCTPVRNKRSQLNHVARRKKIL